MIIVVKQLVKNCTIGLTLTVLVHLLPSVLSKVMNLHYFFEAHIVDILFVFYISFLMYLSDSYVNGMEVWF